MRKVRGGEKIGEGKKLESDLSFRERKEGEEKMKMEREEIEIVEKGMKVMVNDG